VVDNRHRGNWHLEPYTIRTLIFLLYGTGLRIGEAIRLQHRDVDLNDAILTVRTSIRAAGKEYRGKLLMTPAEIC
jgi:integrase/recombinase XerD